MTNLNNILTAAVWQFPVIFQKANGLFTSVKNITVRPDDQESLGTNLHLTDIRLNSSYRLFGTWDSEQYQYDSETGRWESIARFE